ncbi:hypothetical protein BUALT_BualtUnG0019500 [Buddleja alternifolia]|uniref:Uncharacterized protein n=1 Tax=Buddleja alternifolia TaxID=168488 RepID=A0AAV6W5J1_9LAMI|nr:hypothetical protein BUALT_BualtUnG0019500 [Buddleja alternifolia]
MGKKRKLPNIDPNLCGIVDMVGDVKTLFGFPEDSESENELVVEDEKEVNADGNQAEEMEEENKEGEKDDGNDTDSWHHKDSSESDELDGAKNIYKDPDDGRQRFLLELEFEQCLANPTYTH